MSEPAAGPESVAEPREAGVLEEVYLALTSEDDGRACEDIPESACREQPGHFARHVLALASTKTGDGLADPKLVLTWLLGTLGAPAGLVGWLVPVREAGALLPQLLIGAWVRSRPLRRTVWAAGSVVQGLCVAGMGLVAARLEGPAAGWAVLALLAVFSVARAFCSVSYKDVLGKTLARSTRGTATGTASSLAAGLVLAFGALLSTGVLGLDVGTIAASLGVAALLWILASGLVLGLDEEPGATAGGGNPLDLVRRDGRLLREDGQFARLVAARSLLVPVALAPPFLLALGSAAGTAADAGPGRLGPLVLAAALARLLSSYVWGRLADRSSRRVLVLAGRVGALALAAAALAGLLDVHVGTAPLATLLFVLVVAHQGVRLGRSTHLVDMAPADLRASYTALSNTVVGGVLLLGGGLGLVAQWLGAGWALLACALLSLAGAAVASGLEEVQAARS